MIYKLGRGVFAIDAEYVMPRAASVYAVHTDHGAMLFETAHNASLRVVLRELETIDVCPADVSHIFITHVHLDHAGGAGLYMRYFPKAQLVLHPRGVPHMADPSRLWKGACAVYGDDRARELYGDLVPVPRDRMIAPEDGDTITEDGRSVVCMHTPGHCLHHMAYLLEDDRSVFTGDVFGMTHDGISSETRKGLVASTSPVQFDPDAMIESVRRIMALEPRRLLLSHFGELCDAALAAGDMERMVERHVRAANAGAGDFEATRALVAQIFEDERAAQGWPMTGTDIERWLRELSGMNAMGLADWYQKKVRKNV